MSALSRVPLVLLLVSPLAFGGLVLADDQVVRSAERVHDDGSVTQVTVTEGEDSLRVTLERSSADGETSKQRIELQLSPGAIDEGRLEALLESPPHDLQGWLNESEHGFRGEGKLPRRIMKRVQERLGNGFEFEGMPEKLFERLQERFGEEFEFEGHGEGEHPEGTKQRNRFFFGRGEGHGEGEHPEGTKQRHRFFFSPGEGDGENFEFKFDGEGLPEGLREKLEEGLRGLEEGGLPEGLREKLEGHLHGLRGKRRRAKGPAAGDSARLHLVNGDVISGEILSEEDGTIRLKTRAGVLEIDRDQVRRTVRVD